MVRIIFAPKGVENQWVRRVQHEPRAQDVLFPPGQVPAVYRICLCEDGASRAWSSIDVIAKHFTELFRGRWSLNTEIRIFPFTFVDNTTENYELLVNCDMLYYAGVHSQLPALTNASLVEILRGRVQCNEICYLGVCGGALISGFSAIYGTYGLDILDGAEVVYHACDSAQNAEVETTRNKVQITSGCAAFIRMTPTLLWGKSVPVCKNNTWWEFAGKNSLKLQDFVDAKARSWKIYKYEQNCSCRFWWFNLCGKLSYDAESEDIISTATGDVQFRQMHWNKEYYFKGEHVV